MKMTILAVLGTVGSVVSWLFGGWSAAMTTLAIFMAADYITGFLVAAVFKASPKTESGALESRAGFKGLCRKGIILLMVLIAHRLDVSLGVSFIRDGVIIAYTLNEVISVIENVGLMGLPIPSAVTKAIDMLRGDGK
ncbi:MAG: phage holin family protein [Clostridia bacterium]|nr:phage holin family protein [Clostridia bacterium]